MKKLICLMLALTIILSACGSNETNDTEASKETQTEQNTTTDVTEVESDTEAEEELEPYEITWYMPNTPQKDMDLVLEEINKLTKEKINATVDLKIVDWGNYDQQMQVLMSTGEKMDLVFTSNWTNDYINGVSKGAYREITLEELEQYAPNVIDGVPEKAWDAARVDGKLYAIINTQVLARWPSILVQKQYLDKYDFDLSSVESLNDLTPLLEQIANNEDGIYPIDITRNTGILNYYITKLGLEYFSESNPFGLYIDSDTLELVNLYETPEMKELLVTLRDWYNKGIIAPEALTISDLNAEASSGFVASMFAVNNPDTVINRARAWGMEADELVIQPLDEPMLSTGGIIATMAGISVTSENPERCMMLYNMLYDKEDTRLFNLISYGIEGVHYNKVEEDLIELIPESGYIVDCGWEYGNMFNSYRTNPAQPKWYPAGPDINDRAFTSKSLGFNMNTEPIEAELAQISSAMDEYLPALLTGSVDVDEYLGLLLDKLEKAGSAKVKEEIQNQLDAWNAAK